MAGRTVYEIPMDSELKEKVEKLYQSLGISFADAVTLLAEKSLEEGTCPIVPRLRYWDEMTPEEIDKIVRENFEALEAGDFLTQEELESQMAAEEAEF